MCWLLGLALYAYPFDSPWSIGARIFGDLFIGIGAAIIMVLSLTLNESRVKHIGLRLGRISYSLYLNRYAILGAVTIFLYRATGPVPVWFAALSCSIILAYFLYIAVERPVLMAARLLRIKKQPEDIRSAVKH
jgi:peptidoglycan/LPS O-acetylase OafA/YrhL